MKRNDLKKIKEVDWFLYLKRPLDIFSFSSNSKAYEKVNYVGQIKNFGYLYYNGLTEYFRSEEEFSKNLKILRKNIEKNPENIIKELLKGFNYNERAKKVIKEFQSNYRTVEKEEIISLINFYIELFTFGTVFPYLVGKSLENKKNKNKKINLLLKKLRLESNYPDFRKRVLEKIFKEIGYNLFDYTFDEIILFLKTGKIKKHKRNFFYYFKINNHLITGNEEKVFKNIKKNIISIFNINKDRIIGKTAFRGVVKGCVKIVYGEKDFSKFKKGDILVTINSNPFLMPVIKKCKAIIADEGGIMCHAAIISRELGIPCIIGTKIATQALKDGDLVEVDADKGVVKIIS